MLKKAGDVFATLCLVMLAALAFPRASDAVVPVLPDTASVAVQAAEKVSAQSVPVSRVAFSVAGESYALSFAPAFRSFPAFSFDQPSEPAPSQSAQGESKVHFVVYHQLPANEVSLNLEISGSPETGSRISILSPEGNYVFIVRPALRYIPEFIAAPDADFDSDVSPLVLAMYNADSLRATDQTGDEEEWTVADPLESLNRAMFNFNDKLYFWVLKPFLKGYNFLIPEWGRIRIRNVLNNALAPVRIINCLLQLKVQCATHELGRFLANSIGGIGGLFDVFEGNPELKQHDEDFGQTLGTYGVGEGIYLVLPFLGPKTSRDVLGMVGDIFINPLTYLVGPDVMLGVGATRYINNMSLDMETYEDFKASAVDPYVAMRDAYVQYRKAKIKE